MIQLVTALEIARHEINVILRTKRAVLIASIYMGLAILGGGIYVLSMWWGEKQAMELGTSRGLDEESARQNMVLLISQGQQQLAKWCAGVDDLSLMASSWREGGILPLFFWCSLAFLPFLILLTSFDQIAADLQSRSMCYSILRAARPSILLGKAAAHTFVFTVLSAAGSATLVLVAAILLDTVEFGDVAWGWFRVWLLLLPFGLCYLGISSFASAMNRQPLPALITAIGIAVVLRIFSWLRHIPEDSRYAFLRYLRYASPATYEDGMWLVGLAEPAQAALAYLAFGVVFLTLGMIRLERWDL